MQLFICVELRKKLKEKGLNQIINEKGLNKTYSTNDEFFI